MSALRTHRQRTGDRGEQIARTHFERLGWRFLAANWHCPAGELDLVMSDGDEIVFIEVKTRRSEQFGRAEEAITPAKASRLMASAACYVDYLDGPADPVWRIDFVAITLGTDGSIVRFAHIENAIVSG